MFVLEEAILDSVGDEQIARNAQDKDPFTGVVPQNLNSGVVFA